MFSLILVLTFCVLFGVLPIFLFLSKFELTNEKRIVISLGFSPVLLAVINILIVSLGIEETIFKYVILVLPYLISLNQIKLLQHAKVDLKLLATVLFSTIAGVLFCYISFPDLFGLPKQPHADVEFNLGLVQQLKHHFLPHDPYWAVDEYKIYHYMGDLFLASISNFIDISIMSIYKFGNVFIALSLFVIFGLMAKSKYVLSNLLIALVFLLYSTASDWVVIESFQAHISNAASTFYWSLPIFFASIVLWDYLNAKRKILPIVPRILVSWVMIFSITFSKGTFIFPFLILEFIAFVVFVIDEKIYSAKQIRNQLQPLLSFTFIPIFAFLSAKVLSSGVRGKSMFVGIEYRDFLFFESWSFINPIQLLFTVPVILLVATYIFSNKKAIGLNLVLAALVCFLMLFVITHPGFSDVYFAFNALLLLLVFYIKLETSFKLVKILIASGFSFIVLSYVNNLNVKFNAPLKVWNTFTKERSIYTDSTFYKQLAELEKIGNLLDQKNVLMAVNEQAPKDFKIPAYMGVSTWNGCNSYAHSTINTYTPISAFLAAQTFFPKYAKATPNADDFKDAFSKFSKGFVADTSNVENPKKRIEVYQQLAYGQLDKTEIDKLLQETKITHIYVDKANQTPVSKWLNSLDKIESDSFVVFTCY